MSATCPAPRRFSTGSCIMRRLFRSPARATVCEIRPATPRSQRTSQNQPFRPPGRACRRGLRNDRRTSPMWSLTPTPVLVNRRSLDDNHPHSPRLLDFRPLVAGFDSPGDSRYSSRRSSSSIRSPPPDRGVRPASQSVFLGKPRLRGGFALRITGNLAEITKLATGSVFAHRAVACGNKGKAGWGLRTADFRVVLSYWRFFRGK